MLFQIDLQLGDFNNVGTPYALVQVLLLARWQVQNTQRLSALNLTSSYAKPKTKDVTKQTLWVLPPPVTVRGPIKGYIQPYYTYYPTVTEGGQYPADSGPAG